MNPTNKEIKEAAIKKLREGNSYLMKAHAKNHEAITILEAYEE